MEFLLKDINKYKLNNDKLLILVTCDTGIDEHGRFLIVLKEK